MSVDGPEVRLSDAERQDALDMLSEHVRTGRLDVEEFGERSAQVTAAKRRGDLVPLFADLPSPRPAVLGGPVPNQEPPGPPTPRAATGLSPARRGLAAIALPAAVVIVLVLFFAGVKIWALFLLPVLVAMIGPALLNRHR